MTCRRAASRRRAATAAALAAGLALAGLAAGAEAAFWLPADLGVNDFRRVVAFGDSITSGVLGDGTCANPGCIADSPYPAVLQRLLSARQPDAVFVNAGRGGERTDDGAARIPFVLAVEHPGFVLIMEGTNDATDQAAGGRFDPGNIVANLRTMVQIVKASGAIPILGAIAPNFRPSGLQFADGARSIIAAVNAMLPGVAAEEGIRYVDTFEALSNIALYGPPDLLHPNQLGYDALGAAWQPAVDDALDQALVLLARVYLLRLNSERLRPGEVLRVDLTVADRVTAGHADIYLGLVLPPGADPLLGCLPGQSVAFVADEFAEVIAGCLADPDLAVPLARDRLFREPIPLSTVPGFWALALPAGTPTGTYTLFLVVTAAGDLTNLLVQATHTFEVAP